MEENKNEEEKVVEVINDNKNDSAKPTNKVVEFIKAKKSIIGIAIVVIIAIIIIIDLIFVSPKEAVKKCIKSISSGKIDKAYDYVDLAGVEVFSDLTEDEYDDFWSEYKDFKDSDEYEDLMDEYEDYLDEDSIDEFADLMEDYDVSFKLKKISKVKKVASHLYRVTAKVEISYEDDSITSTMYFYVMKNGTKSYIVGLDGDGTSSLFGYNSILSSY